ncbi:MAG: hypothetical protein OSJ23_10100 [Mucispirillum schaedleri]|nr:hypothetical protein [Mucispirillum schaedleri]
MEQKQEHRTKWKTTYEKQKEIMSISDRQERINAIARNLELFIGKKER